MNLKFKVQEGGPHCACAMRLGWACGYNLTPTSLCLVSNLPVFCRAQFTRNCSHLDLLGMAVSLDKQPLLANGEEPEDDYPYYKDDADDDSQLRGIAEADFFPIESDEILLMKGTQVSLSLSLSLSLSPLCTTLQCMLL